VNWIKKLFNKKEEKQGTKSVVSNSLSFKEQMKQDLIPRVWQMAEKEKEHLSWLIDNNAPKEMVDTSRKYLSHFRQRHKEYNDYVSDLC
jgi:hypothetical protein